MTKEDVVQEINSLRARVPFSPFRIALESGVYHSYDETQELMFLSWGVYITMFQTEWSSFSYESIIGFDSLIEYDPDPHEPQ